MGVNESISKCSEETSDEDPMNALMDFKTVEAPYLKPLTARTQKKTYTLVLDLDETLVHY